MNPVAEDILMHYGIKRRSGRYPWGSGDNPYQRSGDFLSRIEQLHKDGYSEKQICEELAKENIHMSTTDLRAYKSIAKAERRSVEVARAKSLREDGKSLQEIANIMGYSNDSSIRALLNENAEFNMNKARATADIIKKAVDEKGIIDVGEGVELSLGNGISKEKLNQALAILEADGYPVYGAGIPQVTNPGRQINMRVVCPPGTEYKDIYNFENVHSFEDYVSYDGGESYRKAFEFPSSLDSKRLMIKYAEEGGIDKDGVIEVRRGKEDLYLGDGVNYAQVRIMVDGTHYLKGMAVYADDLPDGIDVRFNTNKTSDKSKMDVLKEVKRTADGSVDQVNPFGSLIKEKGGQRYYDDPDGKFVDPITGHKQSLSLINKRSDEGDWGEWGDSLPAQFLSKQNIKLAKRQLDMAIEDKKMEYKEIMDIPNPTLRKHFLNSYAMDCDKAAEDLDAAALPRQKYHVILPVSTISDNEVYAPQYKDGETLALVRFPHEGTYQIPILKVNNRNPEAKRVIGTDAKDAVGISAKTAGRLSGADFDGDTVMVIPTNKKVAITSTPLLRGLEDFEPKTVYGSTKVIDNDGNVKYLNAAGKEFKLMKNTQNEMGRISNLITDMTIKNATDEELAAATRHSMTVIDAEKHHLDYKQSFIDNHIAELKTKYQGHTNKAGNYSEGASTLISRAGAEETVDKRQGSPRVNMEYTVSGEKNRFYDPTKPEGSLIFKTADKLYYTDKKTGKEVKRTQASTQMAETTDARTLISDNDTEMEHVYADYANTMKALANQSRKEAYTTPGILINSSAKVTYAAEVASLKSKLNTAIKNAPKERAAQRIANSQIKAIKDDNPDISKKDIRKQSQRALTNARETVGASGKKSRIDITPKEWEAIQAGAVSSSVLNNILNHTDADKLREMAMPYTSTTLSTAKQDRIKSLSANGYTQSQIAEYLNISTATVNKYL